MTVLEFKRQLLRALNGSQGVLRETKERLNRPSSEEEKRKIVIEAAEIAGKVETLQKVWELAKRLEG